MSVEFERRSRKKRRWGRVIEYSSFERKYLYGEGYKEEYEKIKKSLGRYKSGLTPQEISLANEIRVSVAKQILADLEAEGLVKLAVKTTRVRFYVPTGLKE